MGYLLCSAKFGMELAQDRELERGMGRGARDEPMWRGSTSPHRTLVATPTTLEVGVPDGTQGWLRIRAQVSDQGQVSASLAGGSSASQEMLHRELPALNAFLHNEQMPVYGRGRGAELRCGRRDGGRCGSSDVVPWRVSGGSNGEPNWRPDGRGVR